MARGGTERGVNCLLLHNITDASVLCGDTLTNPLHSVADGRLRRFDRVLTSPPFSMNVEVCRSWGDRYETSLVDLETQSEAAAARLGARLKELGYV